MECLRRTIAFAYRNQRRIGCHDERGVLNIFDSKLIATLMYLLLHHRKQVERLETLLTKPCRRLICGLDHIFGPNIWLKQQLPRDKRFIEYDRHQSKPQSFGTVFIR